LSSRRREIICVGEGGIDMRLGYSDTDSDQQRLQEK
jgi:hypothetical protein